MEIKDVTPEEAEYLLIADNEEGRQADEDPIRKARRAKFLAEYWGVRLGRGGDKKSMDKMSIDKLEDVAEGIGEDYKTTKCLLKLNDLIPELQALVSSGKLGTTAAEQLAYLSVCPSRRNRSYTGLWERPSANSPSRRPRISGPGPSRAPSSCGAPPERVSPRNVF